MNQQYLSDIQASELLNVRLSTLARWGKSQWLSPAIVKVDKDFVYLRSELDKLLSPANHEGENAKFTIIKENRRSRR